MAEIDQQFVEFIIKSLVNNPDKVEIERSIDEKGVLLELTVDPEDLGRVIGKRGATAQSVRTLLRALGTKNDARYNLKIVDNGDPANRKPRKDDAAESNTKDASSDDVQEDNKEKDAAPDDPEVTEEEPVKEEKAEDPSESLAEKTRKELDDLDDLDI